MTNQISAVFILTMIYYTYFNFPFLIFFSLIRATTSKSKKQKSASTSCKSTSQPLGQHVLLNTKLHSFKFLLLYISICINVLTSKFNKACGIQKIIEKMFESIHYTSFYACFFGVNFFVR